MRLVLANAPGFRSVLTLVLGFLMGCVAAVAIAATEIGLHATQKSGLMWNRTGLPAVFPLQVKTSAGQDYYLKLIDHKTGEDAMAAYIVGGVFFKVLVPPGTYVLRFVAGEGWQGEDRLFGADENTRTFELEGALTFEIRDRATKSGHLVDITKPPSGQREQADIMAQFICQTTRTQFQPPRVPVQIETGHYNDEIHRRTGGFATRQWRPERERRGEYLYPHQLYKYFSYPRSVVRSRFC